MPNQTATTPTLSPNSPLTTASFMLQHSTSFPNLLNVTPAPLVQPSTQLPTSSKASSPVPSTTSSTSMNPNAAPFTPQTKSPEEKNENEKSQQSKSPSVGFVNP